MGFKVPKEIDMEDRIVWFLTMRQLVICMIGFGIGYLAKNNLDSYTWPIVVAIDGILVFAFAFVRIQDMSFFQFLLSGILYLIEPHDRVWQQHADQFRLPPQVRKRDDAAAERERREETRRQRMIELARAQGRRFGEDEEERRLDLRVVSPDDVRARLARRGMAQPEKSAALTSEDLAPDGSPAELPTEANLAPAQDPEPLATSKLTHENTKTRTPDDFQLSGESGPDAELSWHEGEESGLGDQVSEESVSAAAETPSPTEDTPDASEISPDQDEAVIPTLETPATSGEAEIEEETPRADEVVAPQAPAVPAPELTSEMPRVEESIAAAPDPVPDDVVQAPEIVPIPVADPTPPTQPIVAPVAEPAATPTPSVAREAVSPEMNARAPEPRSGAAPVVRPETRAAAPSAPVRPAQPFSSQPPRGGGNGNRSRIVPLPPIPSTRPLRTAESGFAPSAQPAPAARPSELTPSPRTTPTPETSPAPEPARVAPMNPLAALGIDAWGTGLVDEEGDPGTSVNQSTDKPERVTDSLVHGITGSPASADDGVIRPGESLRF